MSSYSENSGNTSVRKNNASKTVAKTQNSPTAGYYPGWNLDLERLKYKNYSTVVPTTTKPTVTKPNDFKDGRGVENRNTIEDRVSGNTATASARFLTPDQFQFNLPPHSWSLPVRPRDVNVVDDKAKPAAEKDLASFHGRRRGRIWRYQALNYDVTEGQTGAKSKVKPLDFDKWGFQFLWNPDSLNISVSLNMDVTPSANDIFRTALGAFPGLENISVKVVLDRTNDFACFRAASTDALSSYSKYYLNRFPDEFKETDATQQIKDLYNLGTGADLEYLFKTLNGSGSQTSEWTNLLGKKTADIGFIQPAIIAMQLGPTIDSLSYVGWVSGLSVNHVSFTETMIPIRTEVSFTMNAVTGSGISNE